MCYPEDLPDESMRTHTCIVGALLLLCGAAAPAFSAEWHVAVGGTGTGTSTAPFGRVQDGVNAAQPGDIVIVGPAPTPRPSFPSVPEPRKRPSPSARVTRVGRQS